MRIITATEARLLSRMSTDSKWSNVWKIIENAIAKGECSVFIDTNLVAYENIDEELRELGYNVKWDIKGTIVSW